tara:strand:- start:7 stop:267 length:261 start_codon:yes stop_codon:yes gene_type:complete
MILPRRSVQKNSSQKARSLVFCAHAARALCEYPGGNALWVVYIAQLLMNAQERLLQQILGDLRIGNALEENASQFFTEKRSYLFGR